jgi:hypothetical protein
MLMKNGDVNEHLLKLERGLDDIRDDLSISVKDLTSAVNRLADRFDAFLLIAQNAVPIKAVMLMFGILVLALVGVQGSKWLFESYLKAM